MFPLTLNPTENIRCAEPATRFFEYPLSSPKGAMGCPGKVGGGGVGWVWDEEMDGNMRISQNKCLSLCNQTIEDYGNERRH